MTTSKDVFAKRREGLMDEAYQMALQRMGAPDKDEWDDRALGWCLIDLIKRDVKKSRHDNLDHYRQQLEAIEVPPSDDVLTKQRLFAISLCSPKGQLANKAKQLSKLGRHEEAVNIYRELYIKAPADQDICTSLGWELYKICKASLDSGSETILAIKRNLNEYLKLNVEKPSLLHSCILQVASKISGTGSFSMLAFSRLWKLEFLQLDDWKRFVTEDHKEFPSLAERVIHQASKEAAKGDNQEAMTYIFPHLDKAIIEYPDNIWLNLNKAKILLGLGRNDEALKFAIAVTKAKTSEYWTWELLGDITANPVSDLSLSCYCKALLCLPDDQFAWKVRLKLATFLAECGKLSEAKYEINRVLVVKAKEDKKVSAKLENFVSQSWYAEASLPASNDAFYQMNISDAEDLLFSQMPWISGNVGEIFTAPGKKKPKRKLFVKTSSDPIEVVISKEKFDLSDSSPGDAIRLKGEFDNKRQFQIYTVSKSNRDAEERWDIFTERIGIVDNVNYQKKLLHFIVDKNIDGVVPFSELNSEFREGEALAVKLSKYQTKHGLRYRALTATKTDKEAPTSLRMTFLEEVRILDQLGFTTSDIFIPPPIVKRFDIKDGDVVSGVALLNYNKKRDEWGWKAVSIEQIKDNDLS